MEMNRELAETYISYAMDGELPDRQRADLEAWLLAHPDDRAIAEQWKALGRLARSEAARVEVPDTELAWHDIRRAIRNAAPEPEQQVSWFFRWRLALSAASVAVVYATALTYGFLNRSSTEAERAMAKSSHTQVEWAETDLPGASTMVFQDDESGLAVVWLMTEEPAEEAKKNSG